MKELEEGGPGVAAEEEPGILRSEVANAVDALKSGKSPGVDKIPAELIKEWSIDVLHKLCNLVCRTGEWPQQWTQSLIFPLPKKGNLRIGNCRILCEEYRDHRLEVHHNFVDFQKAFDRVWREAMWATMRKHNISPKATLYSNASSAVMCDNKTLAWFQTNVGVRQGCILSPRLFNLFLEQSCQMRSKISTAL